MSKIKYVVEWKYNVPEHGNSQGKVNLLSYVPSLCVSLLEPLRVYLQRVLGADGQDLVLEVAELTTPGAPLTDPADKAGLVGAAHRACTATRAQQLPLQGTKSSCMGLTLDVENCD